MQLVFIEFFIENATIEITMCSEGRKGVNSKYVSERQNFGMQFKEGMLSHITRLIQYDSEGNQNPYAECR